MTPDPTKLSEALDNSPYSVHQGMIVLDPDFYGEIRKAARKYAALEPLLLEFQTMQLIQYRGEGWNGEFDRITTRIKEIMEKP